MWRYVATKIGGKLVYCLIWISPSPTYSEPKHLESSVNIVYFDENLKIFLTRFCNSIVVENRYYVHRLDIVVSCEVYVYLLSYHFYFFLIHTNLLYTRVFYTMG
ncbi:MAG: hypothetical protein KatS3mg101_0636 [Patescibacteria group bacterium]|nr:MAG: hypothetical protein KatS3mg101_0636 [Patescibacteria group bacterium]